MKYKILKLIKYYSIKNRKKGFRILKNLLYNFFKSINPDYFKKPTTFVFRITNKCNLRCIQCGQWGDNGCLKAMDNLGFSDELSSKFWIEFLEKNDGQIPYIYFWGGEPFIKPGFMDILKKTKILGIPIEISTNGTFLEETPEDIIASEIDYLRVSLDGPEEIHNEIRIGEGNVFKKTLKGMDNLVKIKKQVGSPLPLIEICMTITKENQNHIKQVYEISKEIGVDVFHLQFGIFTTKKLEEETISEYQETFNITPTSFKGFIRDVGDMEYENISKQVDEIKQDRSKNRIIFRQTPFFDFDVKQYFQNPEKKLKTTQCMIPWNLIEFMPNGDVNLCMDFSDLTVGNIKKDEWRDIWNNEIYRKFRGKIKTGLFPSCSRCCNYLGSSQKSYLFIKKMFF